MSVYLVGYDLHPNEEYEDLIDTIKRISSDWWHCLDSTWLIVHPGSAGDIRAALLPHLRRPQEQATETKRAGDKLLVALMATGDSAWTGSLPDECRTWLKSNL